MSRVKNTASSSELVPLEDRLRYLQGFRLAVVLAVVAVTFAFADALVVDRTDLAEATGAYVALVAVGQLLWRVWHSGRVLVFGTLLIADGVLLAWTSYATGGFASPLRYLILLHLITVALLASYRTGLKLALWHSLLLLVVHYAQEGGQLHPLDATGGAGTPFQQLIAFSTVFWFVALVTASFSAINERELRRRRYDLEALARMSARLDTATDSREVADVVAEAVCDTFEFDRAVLVAAPADGALALLAQRGAGDDVGEPVAPAAGSVVAEAMTTRRTQFVARLDPGADAWLATLLPGAHNLIVLPLIAGEGTAGVIVVEYAQRGGARLQRRIVSMVERFTAHGTLALRNAWLLEEARRHATTDGLTGLANRRAFDSALALELERASRGGDDVSLVMLDLDHFKRVNDEHGHQTGDEVLRRAAAVVADCCRAYDVAARYGREEVALILPRTRAPGCLAVAQRARAELEQRLHDPLVTASLGVATFP